MNQWSARYALCLASLTIVLTFMSIATGDTMGPRIVDQKEFSIIGIEARTNNVKEMTGDGVIPKQWEKFIKEGILQKIPNKPIRTFSWFTRTTRVTGTATILTSLERK